MRTYIGVKAVQAESQGYRDFERSKGNQAVDEDIPDRPGYRVVYPDGYTSWSPRDVFEEAYIEVPERVAANMVDSAREFVTEMGLHAAGQQFLDEMGG